MTRLGNFANPWYHLFVSRFVSQCSKLLPPQRHEAHVIPRGSNDRSNLLPGIRNFPGSKLAEAPVQDPTEGADLGQSAVDSGWQIASLWVLGNGTTYELHRRSSSCTLVLPPVWITVDACILLLYLSAATYCTPGNARRRTMLAEVQIALGRVLPTGTISNGAVCVLERMRIS